MPLYKVKISHIGDKGAMVIDPCVVDATSVIDAEAKIASSQLFDEYTVESITKPRISSVITGAGEKFYRCKTAVATVPDKMSAFYDLVQAESFDDAVEALKARLTEFDYEIEFVQLTPIICFIS